MINFERVFNNLITVGILFAIGFWVYSRWKNPNYNLFGKFVKKGGDNDFTKHR